MTRLDELDRVPFERGQRAAVRRIADWWLDRLGPKSRDRYAFRMFLREAFGLTAKRCVECGEWKEDYDYPLAKACKDGRMDFCRACDAAKGAAYRLRNLEHVRALQREQYRKHAEKIQATRRVWRKRKANRERRAA